MAPRPACSLSLAPSLWQVEYVRVGALSEPFPGGGTWYPAVLLSLTFYLVAARLLRE